MGWMPRKVVRLVAGVTVGLVAPLAMTVAAGSAFAGTPAQAGTAACSVTPTGGTVTKTIWMGFTARSYNLRVPAGISGNAPLLIDMHGLSSNPYFQETTSGWSAYADSKKFIVAYPAGSAWGQSWDVNAGSDDMKFVKAVAEQIKSKYCVDGTRVFAEGGSMGGYMAQRMACDAEDVFASAVSTISGELTAGGCSVSRPVSVGIVNIEQDPLFPTSPQGTDARDAWLARDKCSTTGTTEPNSFGANAKLYPCANGTQVLWRTYAGSDHAYPTGAALGDYHNRVWSFLMANPKP